jgi:hypothetical protein
MLLARLNSRMIKRGSSPRVCRLNYVFFHHSLVERVEPSSCFASSLSLQVYWPPSGQIPSRHHAYISSYKFLISDAESTAPRP